MMLWMLFDFSAEVTQEIEAAEKQGIPIRFYKLENRSYQVIDTCEGDLFVIINALTDYAEIIMEAVRLSDDRGYREAFYKVHADRCRKISQSLQKKIGYDREAAIEKCNKKHRYLGQDSNENGNDIGEDALVLALKRRRNGSKKGDGDGKQGIRGNKNNRGTQ